MFTGTYTAIVTPFKRGTIDEPALERLVQAQVRGGVDGIVPVGTTGESPTLDFDEHIQVIKWSVEFAAGKIKVVAGTGGNSTKEATFPHRALPIADPPKKIRLDNANPRPRTHGGSAVFTSNWDLEAIKDRKAWSYLSKIPKLPRKLAEKSSVAMYLSPWDLINKKVDIHTYLKTYDKLSGNGARIVDVIPDAVITDNPRILAHYKSIYLPANYTIPDQVRAALLKNRGKLIIEQPAMAGTLDIYGKPAK